jgi:hypothetical protein
LPPPSLKSCKFRQWYTTILVRLVSTF